AAERLAEGAVVLEVGVDDRPRFDEVEGDAQHDGEHPRKAPQPDGGHEGDQREQPDHGADGPPRADGDVREGVDAGIIGWVIVLAAGLALVSAALFAVAAAAQQRAARQVPDERARGTGLILVLLRRPLWWVG